VSRLREALGDLAGIAIRTETQAISVTVPRSRETSNDPAWPRIRIFPLSVRAVNRTRVFGARLTFESNPFTD
jgi:hypothetical protein